MPKTLVITCQDSTCATDTSSFCTIMQTGYVCLGSAKLPVTLHKNRFEKTVAWIFFRNKSKLVEGMDWLNCQDFIFTWFVCKNVPLDQGCEKTCLWWEYFGEGVAGAVRLNSCRRTWGLVRRWKVSRSRCSACYWWPPGYCGLPRGWELGSARCAWCRCSSWWCQLWLRGNDIRWDFFFFSSHICISLITGIPKDGHKEERGTA